MPYAKGGDVGVVLAQQVLAGQPAPQLDTPKKATLAIVCLCAGVAPLAARWIAHDTARIAYGLLLAAAYLAGTLFARDRPALCRFWRLSSAFFVLAVVQVLNNTIPSYVGTGILHDPPNSGNPLASTVSGTISIQLIETGIAIATIVAVTKLSGQDLDSIYGRVGKLSRWFVFSVAAFLVIYALTIVGPGRSSRLLPTNSTLTLDYILALTPALLVLLISNGFQEELLFRGLFLRQYNTFFGLHEATLLQAVIFAIAHVGVTYTPSAVLFAFAVALPLGLITGYLMRATDGVVAPAIFHAGANIPIYLAFLSYVV